ncbi:hypothetical protein QE109_01670 [Fusibacter bizertensis]|uniref:Uncharacterized protein n=1 Tax=Fusibacter bizertensis TaxID=1488331 RepID=A0ABT6N8T5_9FIRM|nr:hypothetical protein [Fusibacter bizertensis]MDH8676832.1 hypothetical protein [Fusibacter bizertensis]
MEISLKWAILIGIMFAMLWTKYWQLFANKLGELLGIKKLIAFIFRKSR